MKTKDEISKYYYGKPYDRLCDGRKNIVDSRYKFEISCENDINTSMLHKVKRNIERLFLEWMF